MSKKLYMTVTLVTLLLSVAACKSTTELGETQTLDTSASEQTEMAEMADVADSTLSEPTPEPETPFEEMNQEVAQNDHTYIPPQEPVAPSAPVESLGASSSGLGR